jgi:NitT/TauT family transport system substrate-binding protein
VDLIKKIGADRDEGAELIVSYFGGGPLAFKDMLSKNVDFAVAGAPALAQLKAENEPVVSIAAVNLVPTFTLMIRPELVNKINSIADLRGHVIGINSAGFSNKSTSQMLTEFALQRANIPLSSVHFIAAGQSLAEQSAALESGSVDAIMGDEPFSSALQAEGKAVVLADFHQPETARALLGGTMLNAQLATRQDMIDAHPEDVALMVRILKRTLVYIQTHTAEEIVDKLQLTTTDKATLLPILRKHKGIYSPDASMPRAAIDTAQGFFRAVNVANPQLNAFDFSTFINTTWSGSTP